LLARTTRASPIEAVSVRMILHGMANHIGHFDEPPVILLMQRPQDAALDRFQAIREVRNRASRMTYEA